MSHNFYPSLKTLLFFSLFILTLSWLPANAQKRSTKGINSDGDFVNGGGSSGGSFGGGGEDNWGIALNAGYDVPLDDLQEIYVGAPTAGFSLYKNFKGFTFSGTVDYRSYKPKKDSTTTGFSNYMGIGLYASAVYNLRFSERLKIFGGILGGTMISSYHLDYGGQRIISSTGSVSYIGPKLGFNYLITDRIGLGLEGRYTLAVVGANYNTSTGGSVTKGHSSYAGNLFLTYDF